MVKHEFPDAEDELGFRKREVLQKVSALKSELREKSTGFPGEHDMFIGRLTRMEHIFSGQLAGLQHTPPAILIQPSPATIFTIERLSDMEGCLTEICGRFGWEISALVKKHSSSGL